MRVLQVNAVYKTKSTGRIAMEMHEYFLTHGIDSYVAYATENTAEKNDKRIIRVGNLIDHKIHAVLYRIDKMQGCHSTLATKIFLKKIKNLAPDIVLTHNLHSNYLNVPLFLKGLNRLGIKVVMDLHDCWLFTGGCYHYTATGCNKWLYGCQDCGLLGKAAEKKFKLNLDIYDKVKPTIVATSKWIEGEAKKSLISDSCRIEMIYDWIDTETFYPRNENKIRKKYGIDDSVMILGVCTGWALNKGQQEMIQVANELPDAKIVLVGNQSEKTEYPDNVILIPFTDSKEELAELYSAADVFFNPSKQETFGLVSGEALACGTPLIVYNTTACPEFVTENTGIVIENPEQSVDAIKQQLEKNKVLGRDVVRENCRNFVLDNFSMDKNIDKYIELFKSILE